jgi:hypothetical protein
VKKSVIVQADSSSKGRGAAILQDNGVVEFASRKLTPTEENYAQIEKELLAVVFAMERFRTYIYGRTDVVTVETDHKPLISIAKKSLTAAPKRLQRLLLRLQSFSYRLVYRSGSQMLISDCLSRAYLPSGDDTDVTEDIAAIADVEQFYRRCGWSLHQLQ